MEIGSHNFFITAMLNFNDAYIRLNLIDGDGKIIPVELGKLDHEGWKDLTVDGTTVNYHGSLRFYSFNVAGQYMYTIIVYIKDVKIVFEDD
jgi:hypothetical protein